MFPATMFPATDDPAPNLLQNAPEFSKQGDGNAKHANHDQKVTYSKKLATSKSSHHRCNCDNQNQTAEFYHGHIPLKPSNGSKVHLFRRTDRNHRDKKSLPGYKVWKSLRNPLFFSRGDPSRHCPARQSRRRSWGCRVSGYRFPLNTSA